MSGTETKEGSGASHMISQAHHGWEGLQAPAIFRYPALSAEVQGDLACFTRPEFTSERLSYPVMTPSAAVGLFSSIFWKPQFRWVIQRIEVLAPVRWMTLKRNEVEVPITQSSLRRGHIDADAAVQQRLTTMLRDVAYRVHAQVWVHPDAHEQDAAKWRDQFSRRLQRGQSFRTPYLGMREFHADVSPAGSRKPIDWTEDLGMMLHSISYAGRGQETYSWFHARVEGGVVLVPREGLTAAQAAGVTP